MPDQDDLDTPISLHPLEGEDVLRKLLGMDEDDVADPTPDVVEDDES